MNPTETRSGTATSTAEPRPCDIERMIAETLAPLGWLPEKDRDALAAELRVTFNPRRSVPATIRHGVMRCRTMQEHAAPIREQARRMVAAAVISIIYHADLDKTDLATWRAVARCLSALDGRSCAVLGMRYQRLYDSANRATLAQRFDINEDAAVALHNAALDATYSAVTTPPPTKQTQRRQATHHHALAQIHDS